MKNIKNEMRMTVESRSVNEGFVRGTLAAFAAQLDPGVDEIADIKTAVSEAVTNCIVHAYPESLGKIYIYMCILSDDTVKIKIRDKGVGIEDISLARTPLYSSMGGERAGLGFAVMESFCDKVNVRSSLGKGTTVTLIKKMGGRGGE